MEDKKKLSIEELIETYSGKKASGTGLSEKQKQDLISEIERFQKEGIWSLPDNPYADIDPFL